MPLRLPEVALPTARAVLRTLGPLVRDHRLWAAGEPVGLAVSGGKDSLGLLALVLAGRHFGLPVPEVTVLHLPPVPGCPCGPAAARVAPVAAGFGLPPERVVLGPACELAVRDGDGEARCSVCARLRRRWLLETCRDRRLPVLMLAHHQDDLAQTLLLNLLFHGDADAIMVPSRVYLAGRLRLVRPLLTTPERRVIAFTRKPGLPPLPASTLPVDGQRTRVRAFLHGLGSVRELAKANLARLARRAWVAPGSRGAPAALVVAPPAAAAGIGIGAGTLDGEPARRYSSRHG